jgi:hypothetical protein
MHGLDASTDIVAQPQVTARRVDKCVPCSELLKRDPRIRIDRPAVVPILDQIESLAIADNPGHLGRGTCGSWLGWWGRGSGRAWNVHADIVV